MEFALTCDLWAKNFIKENSFALKLNGKMNVIWFDCFDVMEFICNPNEWIWHSNKLFFYINAE